MRCTLEAALLLRPTPVIDRDEFSEPEYRPSEGLLPPRLARQGSKQQYRG